MPIWAQVVITVLTLLGGFGGWVVGLLQWRAAQRARLDPFREHVFHHQVSAYCELSELCLQLYHEFVRARSAILLDEDMGKHQQLLKDVHALCDGLSQRIYYWMPVTPLEVWAALLAYHGLCQDFVEKLAVGVTQGTNGPDETDAGLLGHVYGQGLNAMREATRVDPFGEELGKLIGRRDSDEPLVHQRH